MPANLEGAKAETEIAKQIMALSTGAVAFTVTFVEKFRSSGEGAPLELPYGLYVAWAMFGMTIGFALWYLMALTGNISAVARQENGWSLTSPEQLSANGDVSNTWLPGILMIASFFLAVLSLIWLGFSLA